MGTRGLIVVYDKSGDLKVAQYGQWDHYPSGQGVDVLAAIPQINVDGCSWATDADLEAAWVEAGKKPGEDWVTFDVSNRLEELYPQFSRNTGAKVLLLPPGKRQNSIEFGEDGLFCEWAWVVDFQMRTFRGYAGGYVDGESSPLASWPLDALPTREDFLAEFEEH